MKHWPEFDHNGDLPVGTHQATLAEVLTHFGTGTVQRRLVGQRLERMYKLAVSTGQVARFVVFGSFVTAKPDPGDVDIFMIMEDSFDSNRVRGGRQPSFSTIWPGKTSRVPAYSGFDGWLRWAGSRRHWNTGKPNAIKPDVE